MAIKSLLNEKVLQYYYRQIFITSSEKERKNLLPDIYYEYSIERNFKGLIPENTFSSNKKTDHRADFILCPSLKSNLKLLNIEIKWNKCDFEKQPTRFKYYNGIEAYGYVVDINNNPTEKDNYILNTKIPVVHLNPEYFRKWFIVNADFIINNTLNTKNLNNINWLRPTKYWVISLVKESYDNYITVGYKNKIWSFADTATSKNISNIQVDDYIIFIRVDNVTPTHRQIYPYNNNPKFLYKTDRKDRKSTESSKINWDITLINILKVTTGWHINYTYSKPYNVFENNNKGELDLNINSKKYTQFIRYNYSYMDDFQFFHEPSDNLKLNRKLFDHDITEHNLLIEAIRSSYNKQGDAREITYETFITLLRIIKSQI